MKALEGLLAEPMMAAAGWTLLHFLWQGALVAALVALARSALRNASAQSRYLVGCAAMLALLVLPAVTFTWLASAHEPEVFAVEDTGRHVHRVGLAQPIGSSGPAQGVVFSSAMPGPLDPASKPMRFEEWRIRAQVLLQPALPWLVLGWVVGVLLLSLRLVGGWTVARRLRTTRTGPVAQEWEERLLKLRQRLRVSRPVLLLESACVAVPTVIGCLRPAILLPLSALTGLSREGLEAVLAHELAHIRRHDFLVNLIQSMIETLLFYHPAVWWISSWVRIEREHCCDDLAIEVCGNPLCYAHALTDLETWRSTPRRLAVAADGGVLLGRIRRLLGVPAPDAYPSTWPLAGALVLSLGALGLGVAGASRTEALAGETQPKTQEIRPGHESDASVPGWCAIRMDGQLLEIAKGRAVRIDGVGRIKLNTKERFIEFPKDHHMTINGQPLSEGAIVQDADVLRSSDSQQETFWELRLNPNPESVKSAAGTAEPNLVGEFGLELEWPTRIDLAFATEPYGAFFRSVPVKSQVILGVIFEDLDATMAQQVGVESDEAALIGHVVEGLPACGAGLRAGDVIVDVDGRPPGSQERINRELLRRAAGDPLVLGVMREGQHLTLTALVGARERYGAALEAADEEYSRVKPPAHK